ncbi:CBS domain-containing protein [Anaeromyxobacter dehalogenans]|uniref:Putative transcriptional regulator, XRE family n=1 Tax=Anaeromyxobacter dehalogenans (strain 2CP-C) TaxID=290397 RepID=Q2IQL5_ANADE|nr:CBS domain-containing protein [Anaeromyxobacter dehalogenans]ABC81097.1 putative transcriptional regulator, XRE family [Anaeromyxobacter dehalogenans 2CP-C]
MRKPTVQAFMTIGPVVIAPERTLADAHRLMRERGIRHLPVVDAGALVGVVSQRDLYLLETLRGVDPEQERVREAMTPEPFAVPPDASLDEVAEHMAEHRLGSAMVVDRGVVIGLFTTVDALRALAALVRRRGARPARNPPREPPAGVAGRPGR